MMITWHLGHGDSTRRTQRRTLDKNVISVMYLFIISSPYTLNSVLHSLSYILPHEGLWAGRKYLVHGQVITPINNV